MVVQVTDAVPDPAAMDSPADREAAERALAYMDLRAGNPDDGHPARPDLHRLLHQLADLGPARGGRRWSTAARSLRACAAMVVPGSQQVKADAEAEGLTRSSAPPASSGASRAARCLPGDEPGHPAAGRALRLDLQPQLRGPPGRRRANPPGQPEDGGGRRSRGPLRRHQGVELAMDADRGHRGQGRRARPRTTSTPTRSCPSSS